MGVNRRNMVGALSALAVSVVGAKASHAVAQDVLPDGVPDGSLQAEVTGYEDGDKYTVRQNGDDFTVLMISANAPESDECFFDESAEYLKKLLPMGTTIYLEFVNEDFFDSKARLLAHTWKPRDGKTAQFIDERMIADGYAHFKSRDGYTKRDTRLKKAEQTAKDGKRGFWADGACSASDTKTEQQTSTAPYPYTIVSTEDHSIGGRIRWTYRAVVETPETTDDWAVVASCANILRDAFKQHQNADVCFLFAYRPETDTESVFSLGRAAASVDGKGWNGEGTLLSGDDDNGNAVIEVTDWNYEYGMQRGDTRLYEVKIL